MKPLQSELFPQQVPGKPMGHYAHLILVRVTESYPLFQTDGELNTARVPGGVENNAFMTRLTVFKRKQSTPERLLGRELLRHYGLLSGEAGDDKKDVDAEGKPICDYNVKFCTQCPDCISYGFAIGDSGSEKSKVITDTAYSLTGYDESHEAFTLNAPYEDGTMTRYGEVTSRINEQDHVIPQVVFPSVVTARDLTENLFLYVLNNVVRTRRYGAQTTRTGRVSNYLAGVALTDGEIFSNLLFTQRLYDHLAKAGKLNPPEPVQPVDVLAATYALIPEMLREDQVTVHQLLLGDDLQTLLNELAALDTQTLLANAFTDSRAYHQEWIAKSSKK